MQGLESAWHSLHTIDELAFKKSIIHQLPSVIKLGVTLVFLVSVVTFPAEDIAGLMMMWVYPVLMISLADLPWLFLLRQMMVMAPFALMIAIWNPWMNQEPGLILGSLMVTQGWISFASIMLKFGLTVLSGLILIATTGMEGVCMALLRLKVPQVFVTQLLLLHRYIMVLMDEAGRVVRAYQLRAISGEGIQYRAWGSLLGQFLLRTMDRADRVYLAMRLRGFDGEIRLLRAERFSSASVLFLVGWCVFFLLARFCNIPYLLGEWLTGGWR